MIDQIEFQNFKCFRELKLPIGSLTLLTGFNAAGKSTTLQSILLLSQTLRMRVEGSELRLNGPLLRLGTPGDVINQDQAATEIHLGAATAGTSIKWTAKTIEGEGGRILRVSEVRAGESAVAVTEDVVLRNLLPEEFQSHDVAGIVSAIRDAIYVSASRRLDTDVFPAPEESDPIRGDVGTYGEYATWWLHQFGDLDVHPSLRERASGASMNLRTQVAAWLGELFPGAEANAVPISKTRLLRLELRTTSVGEWRSPANTGFGLSYAFPIVVAALCARPQQLLIVDSPEAHLHPRGQSNIGRFLAQVAASGVQVIVETHSDHVLNGVRIGIKEGILACKDAAVYFFGIPELGKSRPPTALQIDSSGNISSWPEGFFDQAEADLANLAGWA